MAGKNVPAFDPLTKPAMNDKILVTTDYSVNSNAGIRFAIQLASEHRFSLVFLHVIELLIATRWNDVKAKIHADPVIRYEQEKLEKFVKDTIRRSKGKISRFECSVRYGAPVSRAIIDFAVERKVNFICMATRGAGRVRRIIGTHTSAVIDRSLLPVFAARRTTGVRPSPISCMPRTLRISGTS